MHIQPPKCPICGNIPNYVYVTDESYWDWQRGTFIQDAFPELDAAMRETIKSGYCEECWDIAFNFEDEDEDETISG